MTGWAANSPVAVKGGRYIPDITFDEVKLLVEIDGRSHHSSKDVFEADRRRQNHLVTAGWTVLRFTPTQLAETPAEVITTIRETLARLRRGRIA